MIKRYIFLFLILLSFGASAQNKNDSLTVKINVKFDNELLEFNKNYRSKNDTLQISVLKFYLSNIEIQHPDDIVYKEINSYHLIDLEQPESLFFKIENKRAKPIKLIRFNIGVDSTASNSGANGGDLDLQNGMYWAWQSGYINMKIEGKSKSCATRKNTFQFHVGGFLNPYNAMRTLQINCKTDLKNQINLVMDLGKLFSEVSLKDTNTVMIPGKEAMKIANLTTNLFSVE